MTPRDEFLPDELIRQKNWNELSAHEKESLKELAATEEDFRLLKLMLETPVVQPGEIPLLNTALPENLQRSFHEAHTSRKKIFPWRYAAAAAIVLAVAGTIWLSNRSGKKELPVAKKETVTPVPPAKPVEPPTVQKNEPKPETSLPVKKPAEVKNKPVTRPVPPNKKQQPQKQIILPLPVNPETTIALNTSLKDNSELLQLVAEVY